ncbi:hypothetical protein GCM10027432_09230 [Lysobacter fragariae]
MWPQPSAASPVRKVHAARNGTLVAKHASRACVAKCAGQALQSPGWACARDAPIHSGVSNSDVSNSDVSNSDVSNSDVSNSDASNSDASNPVPFNPVATARPAWVWTG